VPGGADLVPGALVRWLAIPGSPLGVVMPSSRPTGYEWDPSQTILERKSDTVLAGSKGCVADLGCPNENLAGFQ